MEGAGTGVGKSYKLGGRVGVRDALLSLLLSGEPVQHDEDTADPSSAPPATDTQLLPPQPSIVWVLWVHFVKTLCVCIVFGFQTSILVVRAYLGAWGVGPPNLHPVQVRIARRPTIVQGCVWGGLSHHVSGGDAEILDPNHADAVGATRLCGCLDGQ